MLYITIANSSKQVINRTRLIYYQINHGAEQPLYAVRAPVLTPIGGQFSRLIPQEDDVHPGACMAWIYEPLEGVELSTDEQLH